MKSPGRSRVMDLHPQFFDRYETLILKPLVGHTVLGGQSTGHGPRATSVQPCPNGGKAFGPQALRRGKASGVLPRLVSSCRIAGGNVLRLLWLLLTSASSRQPLPDVAPETRHVGQISPDKNVNCGYTTAAFTLAS